MRKIILSVFILLLPLTVSAHNQVVVVPLGGGVNIEAPIEWKGQWLEGADYLEGDGLQYLGSSYISIEDHTATIANAPPNDSFWSLMALEGGKGEKGDTGATGPMGIQGPPGIQGIQGEDGPEGPRGEQGEPGTPAMSGYEVITSSPTAWCSSLSKIVMGGGCRCRALDRLYSTYPITGADLNGWAGQCNGTNPPPPTCYAICVDR